MDDVARTAGGEWWCDGEDVTIRRPWVPGTFPDFAPEPCGDNNPGFERYSYALYGAGAADPHRAAALVKQHRVTLGYSVRTVFERGPSLHYGTQVAADLPNGVIVAYIATDSNSTVEGTAVCLPTELFPRQKY